MCIDCLKKIVAEKDFVKQQKEFLKKQREQGSMSAEVLLKELKAISKGLELREVEILAELN